MQQVDIQRFRQIVQEHVERVRALNRQNELFVVSREIDPFAETDGPIPELVLIGDNPGAQELLNGEFLCRFGTSGGMARRFFDGALGTESTFGSRVLVLNKSNWHTPRTVGLTSILRGAADTPDVAKILQDQEENGRFAARLARTLRVPIVTIGSESDKVTFQSFRHGLTAELTEEPNLVAVFRGRETACPFRKVPHFSHSQIFRRNSDLAWNALVESFAARWSPKWPALITDKGNLSSKLMLECGDRLMLEDYLSSVILQTC